MKIPTIITFGVLLAGALAAEPNDAVTVNFADTDQYTDFSSSYSFPDQGRDGYIKDLSKYIERRAASRLAPGQKLQVVILDVDMAGEFEPWRRAGFDDVRIVKDLYPPRIDLNFRITNADGHVLAEGERRLRNLGFMFSARMGESDPLKFEKDLLERWLAIELRGITQA